MVTNRRRYTMRIDSSPEPYCYSTKLYVVGNRQVGNATNSNKSKSEVDKVLQMTVAILLTKGESFLQTLKGKTNIYQDYFPLPLSTGAYDK